MKVLILGAKGLLGSELARQLDGQELYAFDFSDLDITQPDPVNLAFEKIRPEVVFNCAAYNDVDRAEDQPDLAYKLNVEAVRNLADNCTKFGAVLIQYSTGFVFEGSSTIGYKEDDQPNPQSVYAKSKYQGELEAAKTPKHYIIRLNLLFGRSGAAGAKKSFPEIILGLAKEKKEFNFVIDEISTPTYARDLAEASIRLFLDHRPYGIYHLANSGSASWFDYAEEVFKIKNIDDVIIHKVAAAEFVRRGQRPHNSVIINTKLPAQRDWRPALREFLNNQ